MRENASPSVVADSSYLSVDSCYELTVVILSRVVSPKLHTMYLSYCTYLLKTACHPIDLWSC